MSDDFYAEESYQSGFSRLVGSIVGVLFGILLFIVSFPLLFWNEGRAVKTAKSLEEGAAMVISVSSDKVDSANENKLVHITGEATTTSELSDPTFKVSLKALRLNRVVEVYQWRETEKKQEEKTLSGGKRTVTTYSYDKVWSDALISSNNFKKSSEHPNPTSKPYESKSWDTEKATLGAFTLPKTLIDKIDNFEQYDVANTSISAQAGVVEVSGYYYKGNNAASPQIGDVRIKFLAVKPTQVSIIARQTQTTFSPYKTKVGRDIELLTVGVKTADEMFKAEEQSNKVITWILRAVGFFLMFIGLMLITGPLTTLLDIIPLIGGFFSSIVGAGVGLVAFGLSLTLSLVTISIAWIVFRPLLAFGILAIAAIVGGGILYLASLRKKPMAVRR